MAAGANPTNLWDAGCQVTFISFCHFLSLSIYAGHRHGVMLVGDPMSAKTKAYMLLAETLTTLAERKIPEHHEFRVNIDHSSNQQLHVLGPRCKVRSSTPSQSRWLSSTAVLTRPHMSGAMEYSPPRSGDHRQSLSYLKPQRLCQIRLEPQNHPMYPILVAGTWQQQQQRNENGLS